MVSGPAWSAVVLASAGLVGCAGPSAAHTISPRATLARVEHAARVGDAEALWWVLPEDSRRTLDHGAFVARLRAEQAELAAFGAEIQHQREHSIEPQVALTVSSGGSVEVVEDARGWGIAAPGFGTVAASTPAAALLAFRRALAAGSLPLVMAILSTTSRGTLRAELAALIEALAEPGGLRIETSLGSGTRAIVTLRDGRTLTLVREGTQWRVDDLP